MKTTISVQKTENRNFKTSIMKTLVVLTSVALFSFMASASENRNNQLTSEGAEYSLAFTSKANLASASEAVNSTHALMEISTEESLEVESWMTNESYFVSPVPVAETEEPLNVEQWMLTEPNFGQITVEEESEKTLKVEEWMLNDSIWGN
jgi:hypothetical protein